MIPEITDDLDAEEVYRKTLSLISAARRERNAVEALEAFALGLAHRYVEFKTEHGASPQTDTILRSVAAEIGIETNQSDRTVLSRLGDAWTLHAQFAQTRAAFGAGDLSRAHVDAIVRSGVHLADDAIRAEYEAIVIEAGKELTAARLRTFAERVAAELDPQKIAEVQEEVRGDRSVRVRDVGHGMSELIAYLPSHIAHAIHDRLSQLAKSASEASSANAATPDGSIADVESVCACTGEPGCACPGTRECPCEDEPTLSSASASASASASGSGSASGLASSAASAAASDASGASPDSRGFDAIRADAFAELLLAGEVPNDSEVAPINRIDGRVTVTVPVLTILAGDDATADTSDGPPVLDGIGPIPIDVAMQLCAGATLWQRVLTDPVSGEPIAADTYQPSAALRRFIHTRDAHCRAPGCRRKVLDCDLDHTVEWANGGRTVRDNLAALCRTHHTMRHRGWALSQDRHGVMSWTSPHGSTYIDRPYRRARPFKRPTTSRCGGNRAAVEFVGPEEDPP